MISYLKGKIIDKGESAVTVLVSGVGYEVNIPTPIVQKLVQGTESELFIYTHVREDILALYGFPEKDELHFFRLLLSVSGIGPRVALSIIGSSTVDKLKKSISAGDSNLLSSVPGVGKKTAEKAVIELKNKIGLVSRPGHAHHGEEICDIYDALSSLGFKEREIGEAITQLPEDVTGAEAKIRAILKIIGKKNDQI